MRIPCRWTTHKSLPRTNMPKHFPGPAAALSTPSSKPLGSTGSNHRLSAVAHVRIWGIGSIPLGLRLETGQLERMDATPRPLHAGSKRWARVSIGKSVACSAATAGSMQSAGASERSEEQVSRASAGSSAAQQQAASPGLESLRGYFRSSQLIISELELSTSGEEFETKRRPKPTARHCTAA